VIEEYLRNQYEDYVDGLDIYENKTSLVLSRIIIKPEFRDKGIGSNIMADLTTYADKNKQIVVLTPSNDFGGNKNRLIQFYKRFNFKHNQGQYKSLEFRDAMIRYPKLNEDNRPIIKTLLREALNVPEVITPPNIPNSRNFWHGGRLDEYSDVIAQKNGRYEFGAGLYLTTQHEVAQKYAKGSRKMYIITVENGVDINKAFLPLNEVVRFINTYVIATKRKELIGILEKYDTDGKIKAYVFNNVILNHKAVKPSNTKVLRQFLVENGIDYEIINNAFGFGEDMMVLYNMNKILNTIVFGPKDRMEDYNFETNN